MDKEIQDKIESVINRHLVEVAESNPSMLPEMLFRVSMFRFALRFLDSFISDFDDCLKHLEKEFRTLIKN